MLKPGDIVGPYRVEGVLGRGGMGAVYRAHDERLDRRVALKVLVDDAAGEGTQAEARARMLREARAAAALDHPNTVSIFDVGETDGAPYIAMELVAGHTLRGRVGDASVPIEERLRWLVDVARALGGAHTAGLVHRDIKPENVMVRPDGRVKVLDFGIARRSAADVDPSAPTQASLGTLTAPGIQVGTPAYMAPEQIKGDRVDGRADQFAWGVLAYELLTGKLPWKQKDALGLVAAILTQPADPPRAVGGDVPPDVEATVLRALSKDPADRFRSMEAVVTALTGGGLAPAPSDPPPRSRESARPSKSATDQHRYSTQEVREIIQRALERQPAELRGYGYDDILQAAREIGIDDEALRSARREIEREGLHEPPSALRARAKRKLLRNVAMWAVFSVFFFLLDRVTAGGRWWYFPVLGWGVGVAAQAVKFFFPEHPGDKRLEEREKRKKKKKKPSEVDREEQVEREVEHGVTRLLDATKRRRVRIASGSDAPPADDLAAEAEAQAEESAARRAAPDRAER